MKNWFVIQTKLHCELKVHTLLSQGGLEAYYPKTRELLYRGKMSYLTLKPLFPSYVFIHADLSQEKNFHNVKFTRGVRQILCREGVPIPLAPEVITAIQSRTDAFGILDWRQGFRKGQKVKIRRGPFKDFQGVLDRPVSGEERVRVLLQVLNYRVSASFHSSELEAIAVASEIPV